MVERNHLQMSVKRQAELLGVNRASIYCKPSDQEDKDIELMHLIDEIYTRWPHYGYRRIRVVLRDRGCVVNKKRVLRLMRRMGIAGLCPGPNLSKRNHQHHVYPYLPRGVKPESPDHVWGIDITYIRMKGRFMYLVAIIDWYSRYILRWELSETLEQSFVIRALKRALATRKP
ncbi:integrase, catalytic region [Candidatus Desulforudis audaxviator MP104C]|uniref:Integrase, catalytic region n=1 Tax=Desulforudis audaxviator (strain MP104C) TaxID=477974 RepID=B1I2Q2_DESAP|nr:integrase, catalytic region [Candidatus Desulforudis audaxviator MP104C]